MCNITSREISTNIVVRAKRNSTYTKKEKISI